MEKQPDPTPTGPAGEPPKKVIPATTPIPPFIAQILEKAEKVKKEADLHFSRSENKEAVDCYNQCISLIAPIRLFAWGEVLVLRCFTNQLQCFLKLEAYEEVCKASQFALTIPAAAQEVHLVRKIYHRRAIALEKLGHFGPALHAIDFAIRIDPASTEHDEMRTRIGEALVSSSETIVALPPRPVNFSQEEVAQVIIYVLKNEGDPKVVYPVFEKIVSNNVYLDRRDERKNNLMWAVCRAAINRASKPELEADDVLPLLDILIQNGCRAEQRYSAQEGQNHQTCLMLLAMAGAVDCVRLLLKHKASPFTVDGEGWTALVVACAPNSPRKVADGEVNSNDEMVEVLLDAGARIDHTTMSGICALSAAAQAKDVNSLNLLINRGASLMTRSRNGFTPIVWALIGASGNEEDEVVEVLMKAAGVATAFGSDCTPDENGNVRVKERDASAPPAPEGPVDVVAVYKEDIRCFKLSLLVVHQKRNTMKLVNQYVKPDRPSTIRVHQVLVESLASRSDILVRADDKKYVDGTPVFDNVTVDMNLYQSMFDNIQKALPAALFKLWRPVDDPRKAIMESSLDDQSRLSILMTAISGPNAKEPLLCKSNGDDFMRCSRYPDYRVLLLEPMTSVFSCCIPNKEALDVICSFENLILPITLSGGTDYWLNVIKNHKPDCGIVCVKLKDDIPENDPEKELKDKIADTFFKVDQTVGLVESLAPLSSNNLLTFWPASQVSMGDGLYWDRQDEFISTFTGDKILILGNIDTPILKASHSKEEGEGFCKAKANLTANYTCVDTIQLTNWQERNNTLTVWTRN
jgi:tetratricopeptide (TPR) repeat protein